MRRRLRAALVGLGLGLSLAAQALDVPYLSGRITDNAELLAPATRQQLSDLLAAHERRTGNQVAVLTLRSLEGENLEDFTNRVYNAWGLGQKGKNNGVLLLVAPAERKLRIEVGYGLEGTLTDLESARIIRNVITPAFKQNDFNRGIGDGLRAIVARLEGAAATETESQPPPAARQRDSFFDGPDLGLPERILIGAFIFGIIGLFTVVGVLTPGMGWFLYFFLIPFWAMFPIMVLGTTLTLYVFFTYLIGFPVVKLLISRMPWYQKAKTDLRTKGSARVGGFVLGGSGGSSWSSGRSSSGGFSGGGGRSGGGGSSGSW
jgi:uncharacterized protein